MIKVSCNRCKDIHKFGNKYLPLAYKMQVDFRSHFSGKKVRLIVREIRYIVHLLVAVFFKYHSFYPPERSGSFLSCI